MTQETQTVEDEALAQYAAAFRRFMQDEAAGPGAWLCPIRQKAFERFEKNSFPSRHDESWRYSNLELAKKLGVSAAPIPRMALSLKDIQPFLFSADWPRVVFFNGVYQQALSSRDCGQNGLKVVSMVEAVRSHDKRLESHLTGEPVPPPLAGNLPIGQAGLPAGRQGIGRGKNTEPHDSVRSLNDLNTAFLKEGALLEIAPGAQLPKPVHILSLFSSPEKTFVVHPRYLTLAGAGSRAILVQSFVSAAGHSFFNNTLTEIRLEENASLDHYVYAQPNAAGFHVSRNEAELSTGSRYRSFIFFSKSLFFRNETTVNLKAPHAQTHLNGLFLTDGREHVDLEVLVPHRAPEGLSRQMFRGIAQGSSRIVVNGKVSVSPGAQKTDAEQSLKNLLLSPDAVIDARPQFEIDADDVKCAHGAAIGQLDEDFVFYLKSRGIGDAEARKMLTQGFAFEVLETFELSELRKAAEKAMVGYFKS